MTAVKKQKMYITTAFHNDTSMLPTPRKAALKRKYCALQWHFNSLCPV